MSPGDWLACTGEDSYYIPWPDAAAGCRKIEKRIIPDVALMSASFVVAVALGSLPIQERRVWAKERLPTADRDMAQAS